MRSQRDERLGRARCALEGLSVGDAFGGYFFGPFDMVALRIRERMLLKPPWNFSDDTMMALSTVSILRQCGGIDQDRLASSFAERYDRSRGYGPAMHGLLRQIGEGQSWREVAPRLFEGHGSFGNGSAMRVAPVGAYFADDMEAVVEQARRSAEVTHTHPEGIAGATAVAAAAAQAWRAREANSRPTRQVFIDQVLPFIPESEVLEKTRHARNLAPGTSIRQAVSALGNGSRVTAQDTVPFTLWCAGEQLDNYEEALWLTASGGGDVDTTCAIVGGIVASYTGVEGIPAEWVQSREALPNWPFAEIDGISPASS
jgi:ADP-ribosylglycohydrolase